MSFLTKDYAQQIIDKMRHTIPYNINIMDENGVIIASSNLARVGQIHDIAVEAMRENKVVTVYKNSGEMKEGVNMPITFHEQIVGAIGISGDVDKTSDLIKLLKVTVELLINQESLTNMRQIKQQLIEQFLYEWTYRTTKYSPAFINRGLSLKIDIRMQRNAVALLCPLEYDLRDQFSFLGANDFFLRVKPNEYIFFLTCSKNFEKKLQKILEIRADGILGVGCEQYDMYLSVRQAENAYQIGALVHPDERIHRFYDLQYFSMILENSEEFLFSIQDIERLISFNNNYDLLETLVAFIQNDGEMNRISHMLHIHRNSLNYRLERIAEITNKNPKKYTDMFYLYCAYIAYRFRESNPSQLPAADL